MYDEYSLSYSYNNMLDNSFMKQHYFGKYVYVKQDSLCKEVSMVGLNWDGNIIFGIHKDMVSN